MWTVFGGRKSKIGRADIFCPKSRHHNHSFLPALRKKSPKRKQIPRSVISLRTVPLVFKDGVLLQSTRENQPLFPTTSPALPTFPIPPNETMHPALPCCKSHPPPGSALPYSQAPPSKPNLPES